MYPKLVVYSRIRVLQTICKIVLVDLLLATTPAYASEQKGWQAGRLSQSRDSSTCQNSARSGMLLAIGTFQADVH